MGSDLIFDLGAHKGEDTFFYLKKGFRVVAVEAMPQFCALLEQRFPDYSGQLKVLNVAVSDKTGPIDFYVNETNSVWGSVNPYLVARNKMFGAGKVHAIKVETRSLRSIISDFGVPHYCKIDIEGNDLEALKSLIDSKDRPPYISIESEKRDWNALLDELVTLRALGYSRFKIVDQSLIHLQICPHPAREGKDCEHVFEFGSSGLFGEELPGRWLDFSEAVESYRQIFRGYALNGDNGMFRGKFSLFRMLGMTQVAMARLKNFTAYTNPANMLPPTGWYDTHAAL